MCDTLCVTGGGRTLFGKNSDRPPGEVQLVEAYPAREAGPSLRTQYLEIADTGAHAVVGSRPEWLWGFEHGVNVHGVAIGNEAVHTVDPPGGEALIGMDLVRLGLERSRSAEEAVGVVTALLGTHGQGGVCNQASGSSYHSSFLIADPEESWVVETSATTWAARRDRTGAAISNRISLGADWTRASGDVAPGADFDRWRDPDADTRYADVRLDASRSFVSRGPVVGARDMAVHLREHGGARVGERMSICMHVRGVANSTSSMVAELRAGAPPRAWAALGNPCVSVFVPLLVGHPVPAQLGERRWWMRFADLRERVEADPDALDRVRAALEPVEAELWDEAGALDDDGWEAFVATAWRRVADGVRRAAAAGS